MQLMRNQVFERVLEDDGGIQLLRLVYLEPLNNMCVLIDLMDKKAFPNRLELSQFEALISDAAVRHLNHDPYARYVYQSEDEIPEKHRKLRDDNYDLLRPLIESGNGLDIYQRECWGKIITEAHLRTGVAKTTFYRLMRWWLQRGQLINALLPNWKACGGRGKQKRVGHVKRGRPRKDGTVGVNVTPEMATRIQRRMKQYHTGDTSFTTAAAQMLRKEFRAFDVENGVLVETAPDDLPTNDQIRYWSSKVRDPEQFTKSKVGRKYPLENRPVLGDVRQNIMSPGEQYEVDAQECPIYLVHRLDRTKVIGKPTLYFSADTFSSLTPAFAATLERASWGGIAIVFQNMVIDMVEYAERFGVKSDASQWVERGIPASVLADNGEMDGKAPEGIFGNLFNTPPRRPEQKPVVESSFKQFVEDVIIENNLPGRTVGRTLQDNDCRREAHLTLPEFTEIVLKYVLWRNNEWLMREYPITEEMLRTGLPMQPTPKQVWDWGVEHRGLMLTERNEEEIAKALLQKGTGSLSREGVRFRSLYYVCEEGIKKGWFVKDAAKRGETPVIVRYTPSRVNTIYVQLQEFSELIECQLADRTAMQKFRNCSWEEVHEYRTFERTGQRNSLSINRQQKGILNSNIQSVVERTSPQKITHSQLSGVRENRRNDLDIERSERTMPLPSPSFPTTASEPTTGFHKFDALAHPNHTILIRSIRDRKLGDQSSSEEVENDE